jgi:hypothetical protein
MAIVLDAPLILLAMSPILTVLAVLAHLLPGPVRSARSHHAG